LTWLIFHDNFLLQPDEFKELEIHLSQVPYFHKGWSSLINDFFVVSGNDTKCLTFVLVMRRFDNKALWSQTNIAAGSINQLANFQFFYYLRAYWLNIREMLIFPNLCINLHHFCNVISRGNVHIT